ncbi:MAG: Aspartyl protease, partial [uncultured Sphingomonas sp.]
ERRRGTARALPRAPADAGRSIADRHAPAGRQGGQDGARLGRHFRRRFRAVRLPRRFRRPRATAAGRGDRRADRERGGAAYPDLRRRALLGSSGRQREAGALPDRQRRLHHHHRRRNRPRGRHPSRHPRAGQHGQRHRGHGPRLRGALLGRLYRPRRLHGTCEQQRRHQCHRHELPVVAARLERRGQLPGASGV